MDIEDGVWRNLVFTFDGVSTHNGGNEIVNGLKCYVNGSEISSTGTSGTTTSDKTAADLRAIGEIDAIGDEHLSMHIDEVSIWDSVFSDANVIELYNGGVWRDPGAMSGER